MTIQQKIQAAIDALPHVTGGDWHTGFNEDCVTVRDLLRDGDLHIISEPFKDGTSGPILCVEERNANATLIAASKELAEEVLRLRELVRFAWENAELDGNEWETSDVYVKLNEEGKAE